MKKLILPLLALLFLPCAALGAQESPVRIVTATDLHYLSPGLTDNGPFFTQMIERGDGKVMACIEELTEAFLSQVIANVPDALILSGDLTFNGERESHETLAQKLSRIEAAGIPVLVIPGNHDLYSRSAARFEGDGYTRVESISAQEFAAIYGAFGFDDALARDSASLSYVARLSDSLRVLMVDANTEDAPGCITEETLAWIAHQLEDARQAGCRVLAVSHQNLIDHSSLFSAGFTIDNAAALRALYASSSVIANLSGHLHIQHTAKSDEGIWDIATSSLAVSPNVYGVLTLDGRCLSYRTEPVDVCAWASAQGLCDPRLTDFVSYSERFFKDNARRQARAAITEDQDPEQLADAFAELNAAYFAGRLDVCPISEELVSRWQKQSFFLARYVAAIAQEEPRSHCELTIAY